MAVKILEKIQKTPTFLNLLWTSDEAHFHLEGKVNSKTKFFIKESGATVTVTKERYFYVLKHFKAELQTLYPSLMRKFWFL